MLLLSNSILIFSCLKYLCQIGKDTKLTSVLYIKEDHLSSMQSYINQCKYFAVCISYFDLIINKLNINNIYICEGNNIEG